ncbi:MAG: Ca-activated chloride channel family protein [Flavobacteriales bacterium]|jgi:Ca-activated chloride channel family protein
MAKRTKYNFKAIMITLIITEILFWILVFAVYTFLLFYVPNIRFENPELGWLLIVVPFLSILYLAMLAWKNRKIRSFAEEKLIPHLIPDLSSTRSFFKFLFFKLGIVFLVIALIDPKIGTKLKEVKSTGIDIMFCLDVSNSMLAEDAEPNRLARAKRCIQQIIDQLHGDRIGVVIFAGNAYIQLPITTDYDAAKMFISGVDTDMLSVQGTSIGAAVELAAESFDPESAAQKAIIVITDGENHEDNAVGSVKDAVAQGITLHTIGMGSIDGAPIPQYNRSGRQIGFKEDQNGVTVVTALNEPMLRELAEEGNGMFIRATGNYVAVNDLLTELNKVEKSELETMQFSDYEHRFQWFLLAGIFFLLLDMALARNKKNWSKNLNIFDV